MKRKIILLLMAMILLLGMVTPAYADKPYDYVSLGDSIAVGTRLVPSPILEPPYVEFLSATPIFGEPLKMYYEGSYYDQLINTKRLFKKPATLAIDGKNTEDMLMDLWFDNDTINAVKRTKVITISVGSNDLLGRIMDAACDYGNSQGFPPPEDPSYEEKLEYFAYLAKNINLSVALPIIINNADLTSGAFEFSLRYPLIIRRIGILNPKAEIYIMNIYNPLHNKPFGDKLEIIISGMNYVIKLMDNRYSNVAVINIHDTFAATSNNPNLLERAVLFDPFETGYLDPHPTNAGHNIIYDLLMDELK